MLQLCIGFRLAIQGALLITSLVVITRILQGETSEPGRRTWEPGHPKINRKYFNMRRADLELQVKPGIAPDPNTLVFEDEVRRIAAEKGLVITPAVIDKGYLDLALNFHLTNIVRYNLEDQVLYICVDAAACAEANQYGLPAVLYRNFSADTGDFNSRTFIMKAMVKHYVVRDIITLGHAVLLTDLDMFWFRSPVAPVVEACGDADFAVQNEANLNLNIGFMYVRPTPAARRFYDHVIGHVESGRSGGMGAQALFGQLALQHRGEVRYKVLPLAQYPDGKTYFEHGRRKFPQPCDECVIAHNNWIVGTEAKEFRFREHLMWFLDKDSYYSSPDRKYVTYESSPAASMVDDMDALLCGLGVAMATERTLILPPYFHTPEGERTQLNGVLLIRHFREEFGGLYRESSFLSHPYVPANVTRSMCGPSNVKAPPGGGDTAVLDGSGLTSGEWRDLFVSQRFDECQVVTLSYLKGRFEGFVNHTAQNDYAGRIKRGFVKGSYRQLSLMDGKRKRPVTE